MLLSVHRKKGSGLRAAEVVCLEQMFDGAKKPRIWFLRYMEVMVLIVVVDESVRCVCLGWSTKGQVLLSQRQCTTTLEKGFPNVVEWFGMGRP